MKKFTALVGGLALMAFSAGSYAYNVVGESSADGINGFQVGTGDMNDSISFTVKDAVQGDSFSETFTVSINSDGEMDLNWQVINVPFDLFGDTLTATLMDGEMALGSASNTDLFSPGASANGIAGGNYSLLIEGVFAKTYESAGVTGFLQAKNSEATPVPLPAGVWLFGSGLLAMFGVKRIKQS